jgi:hypothetical protein
MTLHRLQRGLEEMYRIETGTDVGDFVIDGDARDTFSPTRRPREQLLVSEAGGEMALALFIDPGALANLAANDPSRRLGDHNLGDFLLAIEGVSHFIYAVCCARAERPVSQLELELQAEVDKYVTCLLVTAPEVGMSEALRVRLFGDAHYDDDLDRDERERYTAANDNALRYTTYLEKEFVARRKITDMLAELRRFYRLGLAAKLSMIASAA